MIHNAYFLGSQTICFKNFSSDPIVKEEKEGTSEKIEIHSKISHVRNELGLDYGKIDYVMHKEEPVVLDVGKTIGGGDYGRETAMILAPGINDYLVLQNKLA